MDLNTYHRILFIQRSFKVARKIRKGAFIARLMWLARVGVVNQEVLLE